MDAFGGDVDYAQLIKIYGATAPGEARYSPAACAGIKKNPITGNPVDREISTSYVERANLTMRMAMRRFTRLTVVGSGKVLMLFFCGLHSPTLRAAPRSGAEVITALDAQACGISTPSV